MSMAPSIRAQASPAPSSDTERTELVRGACIECEMEEQVLDSILVRYFDLKVCLSCKQDRNLRFGWYELITKSKAKEDYALPESFFYNLPFLPKPNPRHESFAPLKLYLKKAMMEEVKRVYGDDETLQQEKAKRKRKTYERAAQRTKHLLKRRQLDPTASKAEKDEEKAQPKTEYVPVADRDHRHQYAAETFDKEANSWVKECECGLKVHFEKW
ncbi:hypothetical protein Poli38472_003122 [Pythium oligandrum]|uniref:XPA C-terminal domain-containing protein n=1 Tax=Pythium oligandrum TaxID=41045 RepID=A0A8K1FF12_PYTOL|nr:hypothetical protein Poli38472_003122 [Pythium oligandrum]|eukprot:TMW57197.1 hypothetical protein Poli38472_003122 [Pythium oligandrum]